ncbi:MAG: ABC transporter permease [Tissierellia bacterium]|nr:ABC transporter permease [Tissierellia bacterium]
MKRFSVPYFLWSLVFIIFPLILVLVYAFNGIKSMDLSQFEFSLVHLERFMEPLYIKILARSVWLSLVSTILCLLIGYPCAYFISKMPARKGGLMILLFVIPMWMNFLLRTYAWTTILGRRGFINSMLALIGLGPFEIMYTEGAILLGMVYNFLPFMVLPIYSVLLKMDKSLIEAAKDLGANDRQVFFKVTLPLSMPGITSGLMLVFIPGLSTFVISSILGGNKYYLVGNLIEQQFRLTGNWGFGSAIALVLMVILFIFLALFRLWEKKSGLPDRRMKRRKRYEKAH